MKKIIEEVVANENAKKLNKNLIIY